MWNATQGCTRQTSELFTCSTTVKLANALNKLLWLHIESATQQWRKSAPPILSTSHCEFNVAYLCTHAQNIWPIVAITFNDLHKISVNHLYIDVSFCRVEFSKPSFKLASVYVCTKQLFVYKKHPGCKKY